MRKFSEIFLASLFIIFLALALIPKEAPKMEKPIETVVISTSSTPIPTPIITPIEITPIPLQEPSNSDEALRLLEDAELVLELLEELISLGVTSENYSTALVALTQNYQENLDYYQIQYEELLAEENYWNTRFEEYPVATEVWRYLTEDLGYNEICAAGILGNMMVEAGGHSLVLDVEAYNSAGYYGICQWSTHGYHSVVNNTDLQTQLEYLAETIEIEFTYSPVTYEQFINSTTPEEASIYFARGYERCADPYNRQTCASQAYEYFVPGC